MLKITGIGGPVQVDPARDKILNTASPARFEHEMYVHGGNLKFLFNELAPGQNYTVELGFAELYYKREGAREQHVFINGQQVLEGFDILKETAPNTGLVKSFQAKANAKGELEIFLQTANNNCADICNISLSGEGKTYLFVAGQDKLKRVDGGQENYTAIIIE